jgi:hypothetical protein
MAAEQVFPIIFGAMQEQINSSSGLGAVKAVQYYQQRAAISCPPKELRHHTGRFKICLKLSGICARPDNNRKPMN